MYLVIEEFNSIEAKSIFSKSMVKAVTYGFYDAMHNEMFHEMYIR